MSSSAPDRITFKTIAHDFVRDVTEADRGLLGTVIKLTHRPALVIDTFLYISRERFIRPTRYLIFCFSLAALQVFFIQSWYGKSINDLNAAIESEDSHDHALSLGQRIDALAIEAGQDPADAPGKRVDRLLKSFDSFTNEFRVFRAILFLPLLALLYYFFFPQAGYNVAETIVAAVYLHSHATLLTAFFFRSTF